MPAISRTRAKQTELAPALDGPASRGRPLRLLIAHRDDGDAKRCVQELKRARFRVSADVIVTSEQFVERLRSKFYDIVLAEHQSPNWNITRALELLRQMEEPTPLIVVTDKMPPETAAELITQGAADCIEMDHVGHLPVAVRRALSENNVREERDRAERNLRHSEAHYRALVGNLNYGICRCGTGGKFQDVNQALVTMLGYASREELMAVNLASGVLCDPCKRSRLLGISGQKGQADPVEADWKRKDGTTVRVRVSGREVHSGEGEMDGYELIAEDVTKQRELEDHLRQQAAKDSLTGLANYRHLVDVLDTEIKRSKRTGRDFALLLFDLDGLKQINDHYGHLTGSHALCRLADILCISCRQIDTAARFGGDEFALVLPETGAKAAKLVAQRICDTVANDPRKPKLSVSVGVALYPKDGEKIDTLLGAADVALYLMKARIHSPATDSRGGQRDPP